jgi:hypothetical protein
MQAMAALSSDLAGSTTESDRRQDPVLRHLVERCQRGLRPAGFRLDGRGTAGDSSWVRFQRPLRDHQGRDGTLVLLMAHGRGDRAFVVAQYFEDATLAVQTPLRRLIHRYDRESDLPGLLQEVVDTVCSWER